MRRRTGPGGLFKIVDFTLDRFDVVIVGRLRIPEGLNALEKASVVALVAIAHGLLPSKVFLGLCKLLRFVRKFLLQHAAAIVVPRFLGILAYPWRFCLGVRVR